MDLTDPHRLRRTVRPTDRRRPRRGRLPRSLLVATAPPGASAWSGCAWPEDVAPTALATLRQRPSFGCSRVGARPHAGSAALGGSIRDRPTEVTTTGTRPGRPAIAACGSIGRGRATSDTRAPGVMVARPAASDPAGGVDRALARLRRTASRPTPCQRRGGRRTPDQGQGPGRLLERQPLVGRLRHRGHHVHAAGRRVGSILVWSCRSRSSSWPCSRSSSSRIGRPSGPTPTAAASYIVARENLGRGRPPGRRRRSSPTTC